MRFYFYTFLLISRSLLFGQELDSISKKNYDDELQILKDRINKLESLSEEITTKKEEQEKKPNLIERSRLSFDAIMRLGELDWNQHDMDITTGIRSKPNSRFWVRAMFFLNLDTDITKHFHFRSSIRSHPFYAFGGESDSKLSILLNELWLEYRPANNHYFRFGRQTASAVWDNHIGEQFDWINHDGISYGSTYKLNKYTMHLKSGMFIEQYVDNASFKAQGKMYGLCADVEREDDTKYWRVSTGLLMAENLPNTFYSQVAGFIYPGDLAPKYGIWTNHLDIKFKTLSNLNFNVNVFYNFRNYKTNPASNLITDKSGNNYFSKDSDGNSTFNASEAPDFRNQKFGIYGNIGIDFTLFKRNFQTSLAYLYMEKYSALDFYAQYDLARWNSTNIKGPEFTMLCQINKWMKIRSRTFITGEIKGMNGVDPTYRRNGNRTRLDLIISF